MVAVLDNQLLAVLDLEKEAVNCVKDLGLTSNVASVKVLPDSSKVVLGLVEGKCVIEVINGSSCDSFRFKCHREPTTFSSIPTTCFTVNSTDYCSAKQLLVTSGSDGTVALWSILTKQKLQIVKFEDKVQTVGMHVRMK